MQCKKPDCRAKFAFGQHRTGKGSLFPQRKDKAGNYKPNGDGPAGKASRTGSGKAAIKKCPGPPNQNLTLSHGNKDLRHAGRAKTRQEIEKRAKSS